MIFVLRQHKGMSAKIC